MKYLLPCSCGLFVKIETSQAGQTAVCTCGETLQVPSLLQIKSLQPDEEEMSVKKPRRETGFLRKAFLVFGIIVLIPALIFFFWTLARPPQPHDVLFKRVYLTFGSSNKPLYQDSTPIPYDEQQILRRVPWLKYNGADVIDFMLPFEFYQYYLTLKEPTFSYNFQDNYQSLKETHQIWLIFGGIWIGFAVVCVILSFFMPKKNVEVVGYSGTDWK